MTPPYLYDLLARWERNIRTNESPRLTCGLNCRGVAIVLILTGSKRGQNRYTDEQLFLAERTG